MLKKNEQQDKVENPPELSQEDEDLLDRVWERIRKEDEEAEQKKKDQESKTQS